MFELALLADISYRVYIFWLLLGFAVSYVRKYRLQARLEETDQSVIELPSAVENIRRKHRHKFLYIRACIRKLKAKAKSKHKSNSTEISYDKDNDDSKQSEESSE